MTTVAEVVVSLGGNGPVAEMLSVSVQQVSNFKADNRFPPKHYMRLSRECAARGVTLPDELFERANDPALAADKPSSVQGAGASEAVARLPRL